MSVVGLSVWLSVCHIMCLCFSRLQDVLTDLKHKYEKQEKRYHLCLSSVCLSVCHTMCRVCVGFTTCWQTSNASTRSRRSSIEMTISSWLATSSTSWTSSATSRRKLSQCIIHSAINIYVCLWIYRSFDLNLGPSAPESSTLTTRLPSHPGGSIIHDISDDFVQ